MDYLVLDTEEIDALELAGKVTIRKDHRLNDIGNVWLWAYSEPARNAEAHEAASRLKQALSTLREALVYETTVGGIDFLERCDAIALAHRSSVTIDYVSDTIVEALSNVTSAAEELPALAASRPSEDWIAPYVSLLLLEFKRQGGVSSTGSRKAQKKGNSNYDQPSNPRFRFVQTFVEIVSRAFDSMRLGSSPAGHRFIDLVRSKAGSRGRLVDLIRKADSINAESQLTFIDLFPEYLRDEVSDLISYLRCEESRD